MKRKRKVFISGRITGDPNYVEKFWQAERGLRDRFEVVNPCHLYLFGLPMVCYSWRTCMIVTVWNLIKCPMVFMLTDWKESRGARIEHRIAKLLFKKIYYQLEYPEL